MIALDELTHLLKENLKLKIESKCDGHMAPTIYELVLLLDKREIARAEIAREEYNDDMWSITISSN